MKELHLINMWAIGINNHIYLSLNYEQREQSFN